MMKQSENKNKKKKHSYKWVMSVVGECLLIIPVILVLIFIGQYFHLM